MLCVYCGKSFCDNQDMFKHLHVAYGAYFYNGQRAVQEAISSLSIRDSEEKLFKKAKDVLFRYYGEQHATLHTQHCKHRLIYFIRRFKEMRR